MNELEMKRDKLFNRFEDYIDDFDLQSYIGPLIGNPDNLTESEVDNLNKVIEYYMDEGILLPLPNDPRYEHIANYKNYEFTNCIAFEMVIRTDEFYKQKYLNMAIEDIHSILDSYALDNMNLEARQRFVDKITFENFSEDIQLILFDNIDLNTLAENLKSNLKIMLNNLLKEQENTKQTLLDLGILDITFFLTQEMIILDSSYEFELLDQIKRSLIINEFDNGLQLLVNFYVDKEKVYKKISSDFKFEKLVINKGESKKVVLDSILRDLESYYLDVDSKLVQLSKEISVSILDNDLVKILKKHYKKYQYIDTQPNYTRPALHFINSRIINLPINLDFSKNEIIALVSKIKDDYDKRESIIKTPIELLGEKVEKYIEPKSLKKMPKENKKRSEAFALAFCVYDLYKNLTPIFEKKEKEFKEKKKSGKIDKEDYNEHSKLALKLEIASIIEISEDKVEYYHTLMKEYIDNYKYKELITGFSNKSET